MIIICSKLAKKEYKKKHNWFGKVICCRADKHVNPANVLSVQVMTAKYNEGNKGEVTNITKMTIYCCVYKHVCKVCGSSICVFS